MMWLRAACIDVLESSTSSLDQDEELLEVLGGQTCVSSQDIQDMASGERNLSILSLEKEPAWHETLTSQTESHLALAVQWRASQKRWGNMSADLNDKKYLSLSLLGQDLAEIY
jgi:hypothetical protein